MTEHTLAYAPRHRSHNHQSRLQGEKNNTTVTREAVIDRVCLTLSRCRGKEGSQSQAVIPLDATYTIQGFDGKIYRGVLCTLRSKTTKLL